MLILLPHGEHLEETNSTKDKQQRLQPILFLY